MKLEEENPVLQAKYCTLDIDPTIFKDKGTQSKALHMICTWKEINHELLHVQYNNELTEPNALELTRDNRDKISGLKTHETFLKPLMSEPLKKM